MPKFVLLIATTLSLASSSLSYSHDDTPRENAALSYWQAIATLPKDTGTHYESLKKAIKNHDSSDPDMIKLVASSSSALKLMQRGSRIRYCDWGIAYEEGIAALLPHLSKLRQLAMIASLRAMQKFDAMDVEGGTADLIAVMKMGSHAGADKLLISILVGVAIRDMAVQAFSDYIPQFRKMHLAKLQKQLSDVRSMPSMKETILFEKKVMIDWLQELIKSSKLDQLTKNPDFARVFTENQTRQQKLQQIDDLRQAYDKIAEYTVLHPVECEKRGTHFENELKKEPAKHALALVLLPACSAARKIEANQQVKLAMLHAGIAVNLKDKSVLAEKKYHDPIENKPFEIVEFDGGFVLSSDLSYRKKSVSLTFGSKK